MSKFALSIGEFVARTGIAEPTLRAWERRYGFPQPQRTASGHRRYSEEQVALVERVLAIRDAGLSLPAAIGQAQTPSDPATISLFSTLRQMRPDLDARTVGKPALLAMSHAIEDEALARADAELIFGCFQREAFFRRSESRWRELSYTTAVTGVFADFSEARRPDSGPAEIPISRRQHVAREWAIVIYGGRSSVCMVARERASSHVDARNSERSFELLWTVEPEPVRQMARGCALLVRGWLPDLAERAEHALAVASAMAPAEQTRLTTALMSRTLSEISRPGIS